MRQILNAKISQIILAVNILLQGWHAFGFAPQGCSYNKGEANCDFKKWTPPLRDEDFGPEPLYSLRLENINGAIQEGAFSGLNGPDTNRETYIYLVCYKEKTRLSRDILTENLYWVTQLQIYFCVIENGLPSRLLENLNSLNYFIISGSRIEGQVANNALAGLANLQKISINTRIENGKLPPGLFNGLNNLTFIDLRFAKLNLVCPNWFDGLIRLETILLRSNNLRTLPQGLFDELISLKHVDLGRNPWKCSCKLAWLLDWSNITDGGVCSKPLAMQSLKLKDALPMLNCTLSTSSVMSTYSQAQLLQITESRLCPDLTFAATTIPISTTVASVIMTSTTTPFSTVSVTGSKPNEIGATKTTSRLLPIVSSRSTYVQASLYFSTPMESIRLNSRNNNNDGLNSLRNLVLVSAIGTLTVFLIVATVLYLCVSRNKCIARVNPVNNDNEDRHDLNHQNRLS